MKATFYSPCFPTMFISPVSYKESELSADLTNAEYCIVCWRQFAFDMTELPPVGSMGFATDELKLIVSCEIIPSILSLYCRKAIDGRLHEKHCQFVFAIPITT